MLKRNGQLCQRSVPDYSGRLTDFEFLAYGTVFEAVADDYKRLANLSSTLTELEHALPRLVSACLAIEKEEPEIIPARDGPYWQAVAFLMKLDRTSLLLCRRDVNDQREFSVIEQLDPNSPLAKAKGTWHVQMTSNDARLLLQEFINGEREALQLYAGDIVATAREVIDKKYPDRKLGRVVKAISQRCQKVISAEEVVPLRHVRNKSEGIRV